MRTTNHADRVFNVVGEPEEFIGHMLTAISDKFNEGWVWVVGSSDDCSRFIRMIEQVHPDLVGKKWHGWKGDLELKDGSTVPFCFESEACAENFVTTVYCKNKSVDVQGEPWHGRVKALVLLNQEGRERFLHKVVGECSPYGLKTYRVTTAQHNPGAVHAMQVCTRFEGWEGIPLSVDLTAPQDDAPALRAISKSAMYGKCYEIARQTHCPLGYAYISVVTAASVLVDGNCNVRSNIFGAPLGDIHSGKSLSASRAFMLLGLQDENGNPIGDQLVVGTRASDRGLYKLFPDKEPVKRVLYEDEGRALLGKGNIQGSTLISVLCAMFSRNRGGVADKFGKLELNVQLSMLLNLKVRDASEFPEIFTHATSHGLWDRFLFGVLGDEKWRYTPWDFDAERDVCKLEPSTPQVSADIFEAAHAWSAAGEDRDRLAELALRVAYITSAVNGDTLVGREAMNAALLFMEWQEQIRKSFQPAKGANEAEECVETVLAAFRKENGYSYNWREMGRKHHWYEKFPNTLSSRLRKKSVRGEIGGICGDTKSSPATDLAFLGQLCVIYFFALFAKLLFPQPARTKKTLIAERIIGFDKATGRHYLTEEKSK